MALRKGYGAPEPHVHPQTATSGSADPNDPVAAIYWRDEILQLMYWLQGEGLLEDAAAADLRRFLAVDPGGLASRLAQLAQEGYLEPSQEDAGRYRLSALGLAEGRRRFVDEFAPFLGRDTHLACSDPGCTCHTSTEPCPRLQGEPGGTITGGAS
jgi:hypothetical protein